MDIDPNKIADILISLSSNQRKLVIKMIIDKMRQLSDKNNNSDYADYGLIDFTRYGLPKRCFWTEKICLESYEESSSLPVDDYLPSSSTPIDQSPSARIDQSPSPPINYTSPPLIDYTSPVPIDYSSSAPIDHTSPSPTDQSPCFPPPITPESLDMDHPLLEQEVKIHTIILPENVLGIPASKAEEKLGHLDRELVYDLAANGKVHTFTNSNFDLEEMIKTYLHDEFYNGDSGLIFPPPMIPLNNCPLGEENFPPL